MFDRYCGNEMYLHLIMALCSFIFICFNITWLCCVFEFLLVYYNFMYEYMKFQNGFSAGIQFLLYSSQELLIMSLVGQQKGSALNV
jgi:hypothetical protein